MEFPGGGLRLLAEKLKQQERQSGTQPRNGPGSSSVARSNWMTKR